jgi:hypothetical protein
MSPLMILLVIGAHVRLTRLVTADTIFEPLRQWVTKRTAKLKRGEKIAYLVRCSWCMSIWLSPVWVAAWWLPDGAVIVGAGALTGSLIAGWIGMFEMLTTDVLSITESTAKLLSDDDDE